MKLFLSSYYHDPDHPCGIVVLEFKEENFDKYILIRELYNKLMNSETKKEFINTFRICY